MTLKRILCLLLVLLCPCAALADGETFASYRLPAEAKTVIVSDIRTLEAPEGLEAMYSAMGHVSISGDTYIVQMKNGMALASVSWRPLRRQVTLDELCGKFLRSRSYISHLFQRTCHMTLCRYCNALKLDYARTLLLASSRQVTEIALDAGFQDVSYFIALFRKTYGHTPLQYRKNCGHDGGRE